MAELGFFGVFVVTLMQTPRLNGAGKKLGRFSMLLKVRVRATDFDFLLKLLRLFFVSWFIVGIMIDLKLKMQNSKLKPDSLAL